MARSLRYGCLLALLACFIASIHAENYKASITPVGTIVSPAGFSLTCGWAASTPSLTSDGTWLVQTAMESIGIFMKAYTDVTDTLYFQAIDQSTAYTISNTYNAFGAAWLNSSNSALQGLYVQGIGATTPQANIIDLNATVVSSAGVSTMPVPQYWGASGLWSNSNSSHLFLYGGYGTGAVPVNTVYFTGNLLDGDYTLTQFSTSGVITGRARHSGVFYGSRFYIFGGTTASYGASSISATDVKNDFWYLDVTTGVWANLIPGSGGWPPARYGHSMSIVTLPYIITRGASREDLGAATAAGYPTTDYLFIIGGYADQNTVLEDAWVFDITNSFWYEVELCAGPYEPRAYAAILSGIGRTDGFLYGGATSANTETEDVYKFSLTFDCPTTPSSDSPDTQTLDPIAPVLAPVSTHNPPENDHSTPETPPNSGNFPAPTSTSTPVSGGGNAPTSAGCVGSAPSAGSWTCENGAWISLGSVTGGTVTVPPSLIVVKGNLTISGNVVFSGLGSSISVEGGCATIQGSLQVDLTSRDLEKISKEPGSSRTISLLSQNSSCASLSSIAVTARNTQKSCRKLDSTTTQDQIDGEKTTLAAAFKVSSAPCQTKWIILGCVLGAVLLLVLIFVLVVTFNDKAKTIVRPFWARKRATTMLK